MDTPKSYWEDDGQWSTFCSFFRLTLGLYTLPNWGHGTLLSRGPRAASAVIPAGLVSESHWNPSITIILNCCNLEKANFNKQIKKRSVEGQSVNRPLLYPSDKGLSEAPLKPNMVQRESRRSLPRSGVGCSGRARKACEIKRCSNWQVRGTENLRVQGFPLTPVTVQI